MQILEHLNEVKAIITQQKLQFYIMAKEREEDYKFMVIPFFSFLYELPVKFVLNFHKFWIYKSFLNK